MNYFLLSFIHTPSIYFVTFVSYITSPPPGIQWLYTVPQEVHPQHLPDE